MSPKAVVMVGTAWSKKAEKTVNVNHSEPKKAFDEEE